MVIEAGRSVAEVARDLGVHDTTLGNWVSAYRRANPERDDQPLSPRACRREGDRGGVRRLRMANEFLKSRGLLRPDASSRALRAHGGGEGCSAAPFVLTGLQPRRLVTNVTAHHAGQLIAYGLLMTGVVLATRFV